MKRIKRLNTRYTRGQNEFIKRLKDEFGISNARAIKILVEFAMREGFDENSGYTQHTSPLYTLANTNLCHVYEMVSLTPDSRLLSRLPVVRGYGTMAVLLRGMVQFAIDKSELQGGGYKLSTKNGALLLGGEKCL